MKSLSLPIILFVYAAMLYGGSAHGQTEQDTTEFQGLLELGQTYQRTLTPEAAHVWHLTVEAGQYVKVEVVQKGIDVVVQVSDPSGVQRREFDSPTGTSGTEKAAWITDATDTWNVEIVPLEAKKPGDYEIKWLEYHAATERDWQLVQADSLKQLAELYKAQGKYGEAEPLHKHALAIVEKALGPDHSYVATSLNNLAALYDTQGQYAQAEPFYKRALAIFEKALGPDHPLVATSLNNLAAFYATQSQYAQAEPLYKRALPIFEKALGPDHPDVAASLNNLAAFYDTQGQYAQAEPLYKRALAIVEKALGPDHPLVATSLNNLAALYRATKRNEEAETLEQRAARIRDSIAEKTSNQGALFSINIVEDRFNMSFSETERGTNYSIAKVSHEKGGSVGSSMFIFKCMYDIAKLRKYDYFFKAMEWEDDNGDWFYKVYFLNDKSVSLEKLLGKDYSKEAQELFDEVGYASVKDLDMMFGGKK